MPRLQVKMKDVMRGDKLLNILGQPCFIVENNHQARNKYYRVFTGKRLIGDGVTAGGHRDDTVFVEREDDGERWCSDCHDSYNVAAGCECGRNES